MEEAPFSNFSVNYKGSEKGWVAGVGCGGCGSAAREGGGEGELGASKTRYVCCLGCTTSVYSNPAFPDLPLAPDPDPFSCMFLMVDDWSLSHQISQALY